MLIILSLKMLFKMNREKTAVYSKTFKTNCYYVNLKAFLNALQTKRV